MIIMRDDRLRLALLAIAYALLLAIAVIASQLVFPVRPSAEGRLRAPAAAIHAAGAPVNAGMPR
jgi:hypothetical protein